MRLIDADKLHLYDYGHLREITQEALDLLEWEPTVDAIPVEWIKKYMRKVDTEDCGMLYLSPSGSFRDMLEEWEKENEKEL